MTFIQNFVSLLFFNTFSHKKKKQINETKNVRFVYYLFLFGFSMKYYLITIEIVTVMNKNVQVFPFQTSFFLNFFFCRYVVCSIFYFYFWQCFSFICPNTKTTTESKTVQSIAYLLIKVNDK